jgi:hypothetical protein
MGTNHSPNSLEREEFEARVGALLMEVQVAFHLTVVVS